MVLAAGDTTGELTPLPNCRPSKSPTPLSALRAGAKQLRGPEVTVEPGPLRALLRHCVSETIIRGQPTVILLVCLITTMYIFL